MSGARSKSVGASPDYSIFGKALTEQQRDACIQRMAVVTYSTGEDIVSQGALGTSMYFIDIGMAVATVSGQQVGTFETGDFFGEQVFIATVGHLLDAILVDPEDPRISSDVCAGNTHTYDVHMHAYRVQAAMCVCVCVCRAYALCIDMHTAHKQRCVCVYRAYAICKDIQIAYKQRRVRVCRAYAICIDIHIA